MLWHDNSIHGLMAHHVTTDTAVLPQVLPLFLLIALLGSPRLPLSITLIIRTNEDISNSRELEFYSLLFFS